MSARLKDRKPLPSGEGWTHLRGGPEAVCFKCKAILYDCEPMGSRPEYSHPQNDCPHAKTRSGFVPFLPFTRKKFRRNARRIGRRFKVST